jgi:hypothetical protein
MAETREVTVAPAQPAPHSGGALTSFGGMSGDPISVGRIFAESGFFPDIRSAAQAAVKLIFGRGLGLSDYDSMTLHLVEGKIVMPAHLMAAAIKKSRYDYRADVTSSSCTITFFDRSSGKLEKIGSTTWTLDDAKRAGLADRQNWRKYPSAMLFARCISAGYKQHCPDSLGHSPVYIEAHGELEIEPVRPAISAKPTEQPILDAEVVPQDHTTEPAPTPAPTMTRRDNLEDEGTAEFSAVEAEVAKTGEGKYGPWELVVLKTAEGPTFSTLNKRMAAQMRDAADDGARVRISWARTKKGGLECKELERLAETGDA